MTPEAHSELAPLVSSVAREYSRRFWKTAQVEYADVEQECWVWAIKHPTKVDEYLKREDGPKLLRTALKNAALNFCQREKAQRLGYDPDDLYYWSKGDVEIALGAMFNHESWLEPPQSEGRSNKAAHEGGNYIATLADLSRAFDQLNTEDRKLLRLAYQDEYRQREVAEMYDVAQQTISRHIDSAIRRLSDILGGPAPRQGAIHDRDNPEGCECGWQQGPGTRRAMTGARARAVTANSYDGEG